MNGYLVSAPAENLILFTVIPDAVKSMDDLRDFEKIQAAEYGPFAHRITDYEIGDLPPEIVDQFMAEQVTHTLVLPFYTDDEEVRCAGRLKSYCVGIEFNNPDFRAMKIWWKP